MRTLLGRDNQSQRTNENTLRSTFSGSTQPSDPVVGQQWYDTANSKTMQYNGTAWVPIDTNGTTQVDVSNAKGSLTSLTSYLRVAHNDDGTLKTIPASFIDEFKDDALVITYLSPTSFTVPSDLTSIFTANRKVKVYLGASTAISYVVSSTFSTVTTVTLGSAVLDATVTAVKFSIIQEGERQDTVHTADLSPYAPLASPVFTGTPTAPTATIGTDTTQIATTAFVAAAVAAISSTTHANLDATSTLGGYTAAQLIGETSHATNGYHKFPDGTIMQWGIGSTTSGWNTKTTFPITFPNAVFSIVITPRKPNGTSSDKTYHEATGVKAYDLAGFYGGLEATEDTNNFSWQAIGY